MRRREDPWRTTSNGTWWPYSEKRYQQNVRRYQEQLNERQDRINAAMEETSGGFQRLPFELQRRILREAGLYDMPPRPSRGEWIRPHTSREFYGY
jgi:hypothetical protein